MKTTAHSRDEGIMRKAYEWAMEEKDRFGINGEPMELMPDGDNMWEGNYSCLISVFYNPELNEALMRRDWLGVPAVQYNVLTNYDLFRASAPKSAAFMECNALRVYGHHDYM